MLKSKKAIIKNLIVTSLLAISTIVIFSLGIKFLVNSSNKQRNIENTKNYQVEHEHCIKNIDVLYSQGFYTKDEYKSIKDENGFFRFYCKQNETLIEVQKYNQEILKTNITMGVGYALFSGMLVCGMIVYPTLKANYKEEQEEEKEKKKKEETEAIQK